jgi:hypothetical protein
MRNIVKVGLAIWDNILKHPQTIIQSVSLKLLHGYGVATCDPFSILKVL